MAKSTDAGLKEANRDWYAFEELAIPVHNAALQLLVEMFGRRCDTFEATCPICQRYRAMDMLINNPFDHPAHG